MITGSFNQSVKGLWSFFCDKISPDSRYKKAVENIHLPLDFFVP